jgi:hypothetical protein
MPNGPLQITHFPVLDQSVVLSEKKPSDEVTALINTPVRNSKKSKKKNKASAE